MVRYSTSFNDELVELLCAGGVAVLRTDTIYGIVAKADIKEAVERVYSIKGRTPTKSPIILIAKPEDTFDAYSQAVYARFAHLWPGKNSIILPSANGPAWVTRGNESIAYRLPDDVALRGLLTKTGPLVAPSANPEGEVPAMNAVEAERYFGALIDMYVDGGQVIDDTPSRLFRLTSEDMERLR